MDREGDELAPGRTIHFLVESEHLPKALLDAGHEDGRIEGPEAEITGQVPGVFEQPEFSGTRVAADDGDLHAPGGGTESQVTIDHQRRGAGERAIDLVVAQPLDSHRCTIREGQAIRGQGEHRSRRCSRLRARFEHGVGPTDDGDIAEHATVARQSGARPDGQGRRGEVGPDKRKPPLDQIGGSDVGRRGQGQGPGAILDEGA